MFGTSRAAKAAYDHCMNHRGEITRSDVCGCAHCLAMFSPTEITEWVDWPADQEDLDEPVGTTALCPKCRIDAVLDSASGYPITEQLLTEMRDYWFAWRKPKRKGWLRKLWTR